MRAGIASDVMKVRDTKLAVAPLLIITEEAILVEEPSDRVNFKLISN